MGCAKCGGSMKKGGPVKMKKMQEGGTMSKDEKKMRKTLESKGQPVSPKYINQYKMEKAMTAAKSSGASIAKTVGAIKKMQEGGTAKRNISKPGAGFAPATKGGSNLGMNIYGIPNAGQTGPNRRVTTETMKLGGSSSFSAKVVPSCRNGLVRLENGKCGTRETPTFKKGGSSIPDFSKDGKITQKDVLMGRGVIPKAKKGGNWIQGAIKKPGALRESLGVKKGETIPKGKLAAAAKKGGKLGQRARLAMTLSKMRKG